MRRDHRGLIDDEERVAVLVLAPYEFADAVLAIDAVNPFVDSVCLSARVLGEHLRGAAGGGEHDDVHPDVVQRVHQCAHQTRLAGPGVSGQLEKKVLSFAVDKLREHPHGLGLTFRRLETEVPVKTFLKCAPASVHNRLDEAAKVQKMFVGYKLGFIEI